MLNIVIPLAGSSNFFDKEQFFFPKPLIEFAGKMMIEHVLENLNLITEEKKFIFIINDDECIKFHLDNILCLLTNNQCEIVVLNQEAKGAACSVMMAIEHINNNDKLVSTLR